MTARQRRKGSRPTLSRDRRTKLLAPDLESLDEQYRAFFGSLEEHNPEWALGTHTPDLQHVVDALTEEKTELLRQFLAFPYNALPELPGGDQYVAAQPRGLKATLPEWAWLLVGSELRYAMRAGFYLAVMRYADELRNVPELVSAIKKSNAQKKGAGKKRGQALRKKAAEQKAKAERINKELLELPKFKTQDSRNAEIADHLGVTARTVQNYFRRSKKPRFPCK